MNLLFLAKNDAARAPLIPSAVDFSNAVQGAALTMESVAFEHGIDLQTEITPGLTVQGGCRLPASVGGDPAG